jgi:hypothetical protein
MPRPIQVGLAAVLLAFGILSPGYAADAVPEGFTPLFNGKDLSGWKGLVGSPITRAAMPPEKLAAEQKQADEEMRANWSAEEGVLVFDGKGKSLCTDKDYGDFELIVDWKIKEGGDSGIYLRGSPQVQIRDTKFPDYFRHGAEKGSGALWNNQKNPRFPSAHADKPVGEWNTFHIQMVGERVTVKLNGTLIVDNVVMENIWDRAIPIFPRGQIELQNHGNTLYFRDLFIREIPAEEANAILAKRAQEQTGFESIFNGRDFTGWRGPVENYEVVDGAIVCRPGKGGTIFTEKVYADFVAIMEFKTPPGGNNGLAIRYPGSGQAHIDGFCELQVLDPAYKNHDQLHPTQFHGSVYGLVGAHPGYLRPAGEWNFQKVKVQGMKVNVELNGTVILDADLSQVKESKEGPLPPGLKRTQGHFGFAGHNDPVAFRKLAIRELSRERE